MGWGGGLHICLCQLIGLPKARIQQRVGDGENHEMKIAKIGVKGGFWALGQETAARGVMCGAGAGQDLGGCMQGQARFGQWVARAAGLAQQQRTGRMGPQRGLMQGQI